MDLSLLKAEIKALIVRELNLVGRDPSAIEDDAPLFGAGLALDSLDALQLAMSIEEKYGVRVPEGDEARAIFASVSALAGYVGASMAKGGAVADPSGTSSASSPSS
jgi:acyl carrier protein